MWVHIWICICMCVPTYVSIHIRVWIDTRACRSSHLIYLRILSTLVLGSYLYIHMYVCVYVYIYAYMCACAHTGTHDYRYACRSPLGCPLIIIYFRNIIISPHYMCICAHTFLYPCIGICIPMHMHASVLSYACGCVCMYPYICMHPCIYVI